MSTLLVRPRLYAETIPQQWDRHKVEIRKAQLQLTLKAVRTIVYNLKTFKLLNFGFSEADIRLEALGQAKLEGIPPEFLNAAVEMVVELYTGKVVN